MEKDCKSRVKNQKEFEKNLSELIKNRKTPSKVIGAENLIKTDYGVGTRYHYK